MTTRPKWCRLSPFGVQTPLSGRPVSTLNPTDVVNALKEHRLVVFRNARPPSDAEFVAFCGSLGEILEWDFGSINELRVDPEAKNYLYTDHEVPFHWDGAFAKAVPHLIVFHCAEAGPENSGGETLFCDTTRVLRNQNESTVARWRSARITYRTQKVVHYGGQVTADLIDSHPLDQVPVLRFAEPVADLNPVDLEIEGVPVEQRGSFLTEMSAALRDPRHCYAHGWREDDIVIADNFALLHGRRAIAKTAQRHLRRVNVL